MLKTMRQLYSKDRFTGIDKLNRNRTMCIANYYQYAVDIWSSKRDGVYYFIIQAFGTAKVDFGKCNLELKIKFTFKGIFSNFSAILAMRSHSVLRGYRKITQLAAMLIANNCNNLSDSSKQ